MQLRFFCFFTLFIALSGCSQRSADLGTMTRIALFGNQDFVVTRDKVKQVPYDSIVARIEEGPLAFLPLAFNDNGYRKYISAESALVMLYIGRVVQISGFLNDFQLFIPPTSFDPLEKGMHNLWGGEFATFVVELEPGKKTGIEINAKYEVVGEENIEVLGNTYVVSHVIEHISSHSYEDKFENHYWVSSDDGFVYRSIQQYAPGVGPVAYSVTKQGERI